MDSCNNWLPNGGFQPRRYRPGGIGNWSGHLPFAHDLVAETKPELFVELGTHYGESYFGFCQAIAENNVSCSCYAVDTWVGEPQAGFYGESVFYDVDAYNSANYSSFSYLLRSTFDEVVSKFENDSIDILHIDGLHTYEAVAHDVGSWLGKVKPGGIVLLHDIMARHADFAVWKFWDEFKVSGKHFAFTHSWGLGVYRKPGSISPENGMFLSLFNGSPEEQAHLRKFYALCAVRLDHEYDHSHTPGIPPSKLRLQVFPSGVEGYSEQTCKNAEFKSGQWEHLSITILAVGLGNKPLRIDPAEQPAIIDIAGIALRRPLDGNILWSASSSEIANFSIGGTLARIALDADQEFCRFFSYGVDPQIFLPALDSERFDQPLLLEIWLRIQTDFAPLVSVLGNIDRQKEEFQELKSSIYELRLTREQAMAQVETLVTERDTLLQARNELQDAYAKLQSELHVSQVDVGRAHEDLEQQNTEIANLRLKISEQENHESLLGRHVNELQAKCKHLEETLQGLTCSHSWRLTAPLRQLARRVRS